MNDQPIWVGDPYRWSAAEIIANACREAEVELLSAESHRQASLREQVRLAAKRLMTRLFPLPDFSDLPLMPIGATFLGEAWPGYNDHSFNRTYRWRKKQAKGPPRRAWLLRRWRGGG